MIIFRRRYLYWLFKAYLKKWGKNILLFFIIGVAAGISLFFLLKYSSGFFLSKISFRNNEMIGVVGTYPSNILPDEILSEISYGLTKITKEGNTKNHASYSTKIKDNDKTYVLSLKENLQFSDGENLSSQFINYSFKDVKVERPNNSTIVFKLKEIYSPFLVTLSKPVLKDGVVGLGNYKVKKIKQKGNFIESITLVSRSKPYSKRTYRFYPTEEAVKTAFALGEINKIKGVSNLSIKKTYFSTYTNVDINKSADYSKLTSVFFNNGDKVLSDKKIRSALSYAMPDTFIEGERAFSPFPSTSWVYEDSLRRQDLEHAKALLKSSSATGSGDLKITLKTTPKYTATAIKIAESWKKIGVKTYIEIVESVPDSFQAFLTDFNVPLDPDQYTLWHSNQKNNITNYKNLRIDKLLEDGRKTLDVSKRKSIYQDFQKYLIDDAPAAFLFYPYTYQISRK